MTAALIERAKEIVSGAERHERDAIARLLEDEIDRHGLQDRYVRSLLLIVIPESEGWDITYGKAPGGYVDRMSIFAVIRATPKQRAQAFLEVMNSASHSA